MKAVHENINFVEYTEYIESGDSLIGNIPNHWNVSRLKNHIDLITGFPFKSEKYSDSGIKLARGINVKEGVFNWDEIRYWPSLDKELEFFLLKSGDILIGMDGSKVGKNFCSVSPEDLPILLLQRVARLRPLNSLASRYLFFLIANRNFLSWVEMTKTDPMVPHIAPKDIFDFIITIPSLIEQTAIATFLDRKTSQIDQAIRIKEKQIALLKERRQILIHRAVTQGLDPNVKMKDSCVEWIGEIPEKWDVKRLGFIGKFSKGGGISRAELVEEGIPAILYGDIYTKYNDFVKTVFHKVSPKTAVKSKEILKHMLLFTGSGETIEDIGKCVVYLGFEKAYAGGDVILFEQAGNNSLFLSYVMNTNGVKFEMARISKGEIIVHIYASKLKEIFVPIPPIFEQTKIANFIELGSQKIFTAITLKQKEIEKLKEYKSTLINSAVTGKIKVC